MVPDRVEQRANSSGNTHSAAQSGAESGALDARIGTVDPGLARLIDAWPGLPRDVHDRILALALIVPRAARR